MLVPSRSWLTYFVYAKGSQSLCKIHVFNLYFYERFIYYLCLDTLDWGNANSRNVISLEDDRHKFVEDLFEGSILSLSGIKLNDWLQSLANNVQWKVRRTLAASIHEIAHILGEKMASEELIHIFNDFLSVSWFVNSILKYPRDHNS